MLESCKAGVRQGDCMKMRFLTALIGFILIAQTFSDDACGSRRRFLASPEGGKTPVWVHEREEVELVCQPADDAGCRWKDRSGRVLADECLVIATGAGVFRCVQGGQTIASVQLKLSGHSQVYPYQNHRYGSSYYSPSGEEERYWSAHVCSDTGKLIDRSLLCNGRGECNNGEDEEGCGMPCSSPSEGDGSSLSAPAHELYPHGASVTYTCPRGFGFREALGDYRRTCREGLWSGSPPACRRNLAFGRPAAVAGKSAPGLGPQLAVDGKVGTWTMLTPGVGEQSISVSLAANTSVDVVLVRTLTPSYKVALKTGENKKKVLCSCNKAVQEDPRLAGLAVCACPTEQTTGGNASDSQTVEILSSGSALRSLSVAEIAAFEAAPPATNSCALLDRPAHGRFESAGDSSVRLICDDGFQASCRAALPCDAATAAVCRPVTCPPPPAIPRTFIAFNNGTGWSSITEYGCSAGYALYPPLQRSLSVCLEGLWSLSHLACLPESDMRVVAQRLGQQHARSVAALGAELEKLLAGQLRLLRQLDQTQRRLRRLEDELGVRWEEREEEMEPKEEEGRSEVEGIDVVAERRSEGGEEGEERQLEEEIERMEEGEELDMGILY